MLVVAEVERILEVAGLVQERLVEELEVVAVPELVGQIQTTLEILALPEQMVSAVAVAVDQYFLDEQLPPLEAMVDLE
jgi:hypothetical protein